MFKPSGMSRYKRVLQIFRNVGFISAVQVRMHLYYGLYVLVSHPRVFDNLPNLMEIDRMHGELFTMHLIDIKVFDARFWAFE